MKVKGIVFFDYDGTLTEETKGIFLPTDKTKKAIKKMQDNGYLAVLATGRSLCYVPDVGIEFDGYVSSNGGSATIFGEHIYEDYLDEDKLKKLLKRLDEMDICYSIENQEQCYAKDMDNPIFNNMLDTFKIPKKAFCEMPRDFIPKTSKVLASYVTDEQVEILRDEFGDYIVFNKHRKCNSYDVGKITTDKACGIKAICEKLGIDRNKTYAFGDGTNDYQMLKYVGHGVAMGEHASILEEVCEKICDTVEEEGIAKTLLEYGII